MQLVGSVEDNEEDNHEPTQVLARNKVTQCTTVGCIDSSRRSFLKTGLKLATMLDLLKEASSPEQALRDRSQWPLHFII
jgi:hypothetical protein